MSATPFERKLQQVGREAAQADDSASVELIARIMAYVQQRRYSAIGALFDQLPLIYRNRLEPPPASREEDIASSGR